MAAGGGVRVRVAPVAGAGAPKAVVDLEIKRVAAGQVWIDAHGPTFHKRLQDVVATRPGDVRPGWPGRPQPGWSIQARRLLEAVISPTFPERS